MVQIEMLAPGAALVVWSLIVMLWMTYTRFAALAKTEVNLKTTPPGGRGQDLERVLPPQVVWKAHNFTHLMEQPTIFYPTVIILALTGAGALDVWLAWAYVAIRVAHSLWQGIVNRIPVRVVLFTLSSLCLAILAVRAMLATLGAPA
jgi:hypothetical protein